MRNKKFFEDYQKFMNDILQKGHARVASTALRCGPFSKKIFKKSTCAIMIRIIATFANQILL